MLVKITEPLSGFLVYRMGLAPLAVLTKFNTVRIILLVFLGRIVAALALGARQSDQRTHELSFYCLSNKLDQLHMKQRTRSSP
jgi:hypothetical protein